MTLNGKDIITHVAVTDSLPVAALLGWDMPELVQLIKTDDAIKALAIVTHRQLESSTDSADLPVTTDDISTGDQEQVDTSDIDSASEEPVVAVIDDAASLDDTTATHFTFHDSLFSPPASAHSFAKAGH